jgi:hypothetical protein
MSPEILTNSRLEEFEFLKYYQFERLNAEGDDLILQDALVLN